VIFFLDYGKAPTSISVGTVDNLSGELIDHLKQIPNVKIVEQKQKEFG